MKLISFGNKKRMVHVARCFVILFLFYWLGFESKVWAACTSPAANSGAVEFFSATKETKYCNGTAWVSTKHGGIKTVASLNGSSLGNFSWTSAIAASGDYVFVGGARASSEYIAIIDATNLSTPAVVAEYAVTQGTVSSIFISGSTLFYIAGTSLVALSISTPTAPAYLGTIVDTYLSGASAIVAGSYAYTQTDGRLQVYNVGTPSAMSLVTTFSHSNFKSGSGMILSGNNLFSVSYDYSSFLNIVDITNKSSLVMTSSSAIVDVFYASSIALVGNYLYVPSTSGSSDPMRIYDVTNKSSPTLAKTLNGQVEWANAIVANGNYAYVVDGSGSLYSLDVTDPANPKTQQIVSAMSGYTDAFSDVVISGNKLFAYSRQKNFLAAFDASPQPTVKVPEAGGKLDGGPSSVTHTQVVGSVALINDHNGHFWTFNVSNPSSMTYISQGRVRGAGNGFSYTPGSFFDGTYAFFADPNMAGIQIFDLSNVNVPARLNTFQDISKLNQVTAITKSGNYLYSAAQSGFSVIDVTSINSPSIVGFSDSVDLGWASDVVVSGNYAFVLLSGSVYIFDISVKTSPSLLGSVTHSNLNNSVRMAMAGNYLYISTNSGIAVVNVTSKSSPSFFGFYYFGGSADDIKISGNYAYVNGYYFMVIDISNPASLVLKSTDVCNCRGIVISGNTLFQGSRELPGLSAFNIANPLAVVPISSVSKYGAYDASADLALSGSYAFTSSSSGRRVYVTDFSNTANPTIVGSLTDATRFYGISDFEIVGNYLYVSSEDYLSIVDISTPASPVLSGSVNAAFGSSEKVKVLGNYSFVLSENRLTVINSTNKLAPTSATFLTNADLTGCKSMELNGNYLYVSCSTSVKLVIVDISTPISPSIVGSISLGSYISGNDIVVIGNYVYVGESKIIIVDVTNKSSPIIKSSFDGIYACSGCAPTHHTLSGSTLYYNGNSGLTVWDVSDPLNPEMIGVPIANSLNSAPLLFDISGNAMIWLTHSSLQVFNNTNAPVPKKVISVLAVGSKFSDVYAVTLSGNYAYAVSAGSGTFSIIDVSDPLNPVLKSSLTSSLFFSARALHVSGGYAYLSETGAYGLTILNVSNPLSPVFEKKMLSDFSSFYNTNSLLANGSILYVAGSGNFSTLNVSDPTNPVLIDRENGAASGLAKIGNFVISCGVGSTGLNIADLTDPADIINTSFAHSGIDSCRSPVIVGNFLFLLNEYSNSISVYNVSTPTAPTFVSTLVDATALANVNSLAIAGNYAYLTNSNGRITLLDISNSSAMVVVDTKETLTQTRFALSPPYLFIGNTSSQTFDVVKATAPVDLGGCSVEGRLDYISASNVYAYCDGTKLVPMGPTPGAGGGGCSAPTAAIAAMEYDTGSNKFKYCDGTNWVVIE